MHFIVYLSLILVTYYTYFCFVLDDIFSLPVAVVLPTLPFCVLRRLLDITPLTTDDGLLLRLNFVDVGALHLVLGCLAVFTHHTSVSLILFSSM